MEPPISQQEYLSLCQEKAEISEACILAKRAKTIKEERRLDKIISKTQAYEKWLYENQKANPTMDAIDPTLRNIVLELKEINVNSETYAGIKNECDILHKHAKMLNTHGMKYLARLKNALKLWEKENKL